MPRSDLSGIVLLTDITGLVAGTIAKAHGSQVQKLATTLHDFCFRFPPWLPSVTDLPRKCRLMTITFLSYLSLVSMFYYSECTMEMEHSFDHISVLRPFQRKSLGSQGSSLEWWPRIGAGAPGWQRGPERACEVC